MKVIVLGLRAIYGAQGGIETHVRELVEAMLSIDPDLSFEVIERSKFTNLSEPQVIPNRLRRTALWSPRNRNLETVVHTLLGVIYTSLSRPDILHIHGIGPGLLVPLARLSGLKVVFTHHGEDYQREKWSRFARIILRIGEYCAVRFAHSRIAISANLAQRLSDRYGLRFDYIPNAVPRLIVPPSGTQLERLGLVPRKFVLHVGRLVPEKRQLDIIAAFKRLDFLDHRLVLVGGNDNEVAGFPAAVAVAAATDDRIVLAGVLDPGQLSELYAAAKVFVLPSTHEGLPISLLEAMSFGLPVVVSDIDAHSQLRLPAECYFPAMDVDSLATRLGVILGASDATKDWHPWLVDFEIENVAHRTKQVYSKVCPSEES